MMEIQKANVSKSKLALIISVSIIGGLIIIGVLVAVLVSRIVKPQITSNLQVDNAAFVVTECKSGAGLGFSGIQLADAVGSRIRIIANPVDGATKVAFFKSGQTSGEDLGACGEVVIHPQMSTVNGIKNQEGTATISCKGSSHTISGNVNFKNCH